MELLILARCDAVGLTIHGPNVGAGLLANAQCQSLIICLTHRIREQARSHILNVVRLESVVVPLQLKHHFIDRRGQVAELTLGTQAQAQVA